MRVSSFELERFQSTFEHRVGFNLSESGVHPLRVAELLDGPADTDRLMQLALGYTQTNGTPELRSRVADLHPGAGPDHVLVTTGGAEANFLTAWRLIEPDDEIVLMVPNYGQLRGLAEAFGAGVREWPLREVLGAAPRWRVDLDELRSLVSSRTKLVAICNPNNPTGARFEASDLDAICAIAAENGAWVLSDEIYRGAERDGRETPTVWGRYDRVLVTGGLSKAYGLPGLRIGWVVGPPRLVDDLWSHHDYTTIAPGALGDQLAQRALAPEGRDRLLARTRAILDRNYPIVTDWFSSLEGAAHHIPPEAGAIVFARYHLPINSTDLVTRLREAHDVLVVPGDQFGMDGYLRIGFGSPVNDLETGLLRLRNLMTSLAADAAP